jgi:hypothetical protein
LAIVVSMPPGLPGVHFSPSARRARLMASCGFAPIAFEGVLDDPDTGEMLQADAIFGRMRS